MPVERACNGDRQAPPGVRGMATVGVLHGAYTQSNKSRTPEGGTGTRQDTPFVSKAPPASEVRGV